MSSNTPTSSGQPSLQKIIAVAALVITLPLSVAFDPWAGGAAGAGRLSPVFEVFSALGNGLTLTVICLALYVYGWLKGSDNIARAGSGGFFSILLGSAAVHFLKAAFERPRPSQGPQAIIHLLGEPSFFDLTGRFNSFPSGHATVSFALAFVLARRFPRYAAVFYVLAFGVALARVGLGSHYPSDVAGGAILGVAAGHLIAGGTGEALRAGRAKGAGAARVGLAPLTHWFFAGLVFLTIFISFFKTGGFLLFDVDEAVFSEAAREMLDTWDFITPTYNYLPRYDKPILIYWLMSAAFGAFGATEFAARFTSAGFGVLLVLMTFFFVRKLKGDRAAYLSSIALLTNLEFFVYSHSAVTDMTLTFFVAASLYAFYLGVRSGGRRWYALAWAASAGAVLTKGVIGLLFPAAVAFLYLAASFNLGRLRHAVRPSHLALFVAIAAPWFLLEYSVNGYEFIDQFIIKHHIKRYAGVVSSHGGPVYYYLLVIIAGFFPWMVFLPASLKKAAGELTGRTGGLHLFAALWCIFIFAFFTAAGTKLPNYIFPIYPAMSIMAGLVMNDILSVKESRKRPGLFVLTIASIVAASALILLPFHDVEFAVAIPDWFFYSLGAIFLLAAGSGIVAYGNARRGLAGLFTAAALLLMFLRVEAVPVASLYLQSTLHDYSVYARGLRGEAELATYEINRPSIAFYSRGGFLKVERANIDVLEGFKEGKKLIVITSKARVAELARLPGLKVIDQTGEYALMANTADLPPFEKTLRLPGPGRKKTSEDEDGAKEGADADGDAGGAGG